MQLELDFEPGLTAKYPRLIDLVATVIHTSPKGQANIAKELDIQPSSLNKMLNHGDDLPRYFPLDKLPDLIAITDDRRPVYWLIERFLEDPETRQRRAIDELSALLPQVKQLLDRAR